MLIIGATAIAVIGLAYMSTSDRFGRPERPVPLDPPLPYFPKIHDRNRADFTICAGPVRANCIIDGDTFWFEGNKFRIADIDAPEITDPACAKERQAGELAKRRLLELLNEGPFSLVAGWRDEDRYGRKLRIVAREDRSIGEELVREGLARNWEGPRWSWCG